MKKEICVVYLSHQLTDSEHGTFDENLLNASLWVARIVEEYSGRVCVLADWITIASVFKAQNKCEKTEAGRTYREMCLRLDCHQVSMCDVFVMAGPHLSSGMSRELAAANVCGAIVVDGVGLTELELMTKLGHVVSNFLRAYSKDADGKIVPARGTLDDLTEGEPYFVLRAQDMLAPDIVREWVHAARVEGVHYDKVSQARAVADHMEDWQVAHGRRLPD